MRPAVIIGAVTLLVAAIGGWITQKNLPWYDTLALPEWTPAGSVIGIIWTVIYLLTAGGIFWAWRNTTSATLHRALARTALINALANIGWSAVFFGLHRIGPGIVVSVFLLFTVFALRIEIRSGSRRAALLLAPYVVWVTFATYLNFAVWRLN